MKSLLSPSATRREFLGAGLCVAASAMLPSPLLAAGSEALPLAMMIHDHRFTASQHFAAEAQRQGQHMRGIGREVNDLWLNELRPQWRASHAPLAVAGMTTHDALFLLAMMAEEARLRVIYRAHHSVDETTGQVVHTAFGPIATLSQQPAFGGSEAQWGCTAARIAMTWPTSTNVIGPAASTIDQARSHAISRNTLVTWVMAPAAQPRLI